MDSMEQAISWLQTLPPFGVLAMMFLIAYIENIFPPSPSDAALVFAGTLIGIGVIRFAPALISGDLGQRVGVYDGVRSGALLRATFCFRALPSLSAGQRHSSGRALVHRFGYSVIVANRFLAGTRAFVSFFAGMSKMSLPVTTLLSALSAAVWNSILLYLGMVFANNWRVGAEYLALYSKVATAVFGAAVVVFLWWFFRKRRKIEDRGSRIEDRESKIEGQESPSAYCSRSSILCFDPLSSILYLRSSTLYPRSMDILKRLRVRAATQLQHIVLPEGEDDRTIVAASKIAEDRLARITVLGDEEKIRSRARSLGVSMTNVPILDHRRSPDLEGYAREFYELRRAKGVTMEEAAKQILDPLYFGNLMVRRGAADGSVAGATNTAHTVRSALLTLGLKQGFNVLSSVMVMVGPNRVESTAR